MATQKTVIAPQSGILDIAPYKGGASKVDGAAKIIKLSSNEGAFGPSPLAVAALEQAARDVHRYPDGHASAIRRAIAERYDLDFDCIVMGAGSDEIINMLCQAYAGPGDEVLYTEHGFLMYPISAKAAGATPVVTKETDLRADVDKLLAAVTDRTRLLFLANPNNPTGTYLTGAELQELRAKLRDDVLLVIDAAYAEYVDDDAYSEGLDLARDRDNVVMTRTFSKMYGLGGARLGWCLAPVAIADVLNRVRGPFNVSAPAQAAGLAAFEDTEFVDKCRAHNLAWRKRTAGALRQFGLFVPEGAGNFILVQFPNEDGRRAADADEHLKSVGIIVRRMDGYGLPDCLRISIGMAEEMEAVINALGDFMGAGQ